MKLAVLGGSFNPVHIGHLLLADAVVSGLGYDRLIFVPAFQSPFKINSPGAPPRVRVEMLAAAIAGDPRMTIDDCEIRRGGISYTVDTLIDIIRRYEPEGKPALILGDDLASTFRNWRSPDEIARLADFIIAGRERGEASESFPYPYTALKNEIVNASSSQIRERIAEGGAWRYFVPQSVRSIIEDRGLYGFRGPRTEEDAPAGQPDSRNERIIRIENDVRAELDLERFLHSRNTALLAWDLCRRFGLDPQKGYLAGISHDLCKGMGTEALTRLARADGGGISKLEQVKPDLLHARAAAVQIQRKYFVADTDIIEAIRYHTTGNRDMGPLAKLVYIADKIEISRTKIDPVLRRMSGSAGLEELFAAVLHNTVNYLKDRNSDISYGTKRLLAAMQKRNIP